MKSSAIHILVVDDETPVRTLLRTSLCAEGYEVIDAATGKAALHAMEAEPDLMILSLEMQDLPSLDLVRNLRRDGISRPVFALSSDGDEVKKVEAFAQGVNDYVTKPFGMAEMLARVRRTLRHRLQAHDRNSRFEADGLCVDLSRRIVTIGGREIELTAKEYELLELMVRNAGRVLTRNFLLRRLWGPKTGSQHLRFYVKQLRQKIEPSPRSPKYIKTLSGVGYQLVEPE